MNQENYGNHSVYNWIESSKNFEIRYCAQIRHTGLRTNNVIKDTNLNAYGDKIKTQFDIWDDRWNNIEAKRILNEEKLATLQSAEEKTITANLKLKEIENLLISSIDVSAVVDFKSLKNNSKFKTPNPIEMQN